LAVFACLGLYQWITRKSLKKVDQELLWFPLPLAIMAVVFIIFDKIIVLATRPNGSGEPSFPSTHVMVVATIFSKAMPQIMVHPIILLALLGIGGGIFKTAKAIKAENGK
jgi:hypothetical protein